MRCSASVASAAPSSSASRVETTVLVARARPSSLAIAWM